MQVRYYEGDKGDKMLIMEHICQHLPVSKFIFPRKYKIDTRDIIADYTSKIVLNYN